MTKTQYPWDNHKRGDRDNYGTPEELYKILDQEFHFDHDPCPLNPEGMRMVDGLGDWGKSNFVNPPYSEKTPWIEKAIQEQKRGNLTVMLLPVDTSTNWFHDLIMPHAEVRWLRHRLKFGKFDKHYPAKFASMLCIFRPMKSPSGDRAGLDAPPTKREQLRPDTVIQQKGPEE